MVLFELSAEKVLETLAENELEMVECAGVLAVRLVVV